MSMLAEPRRKQKWSVDPRNSAWSNDESKFGQKMLERMGWSKGKGLGRTEQGSTEHVKVKVKNNNLGLGTAANHEDNWIAHQDDFNQLLADLNNCHSQNGSKEPIAEEKQGFSLEEKSKTSKKRVHYMKFTKGKDLSRRSETDLACIFGKRAKHSRDPEEGEKEEPEASATPEADVEAIVKTVPSTLTMQQYFAQRMAQLKKGRGEARAPASSPEAEEEEDGSGTQVPAEASDSTQNTTDNDPEEPRSKKKKKKKSKREASVEATEEDALSPVTAECADEETRSERKKKKRKRAEKDEAVDCSAAAGEEQNCEEEAETPTLKKRKKKKKQKDTNAGADLVNTQEPTENVEEKKSKKDKKKKRKELD